MRMGGIIPALIEVRPPPLPFRISEWTRKFFEEGKRDEEFEEPEDRLPLLGINDLRQGMIHNDPFAVFRGKGRKIPETSGHPFGIDDIAAEQGPAAIEFEIEIAAVSSGTDKELDAAVLVHRVHVPGPQAADIPVFDTEESVDASCVIQELHTSPGVVAAAFLPEMSESQRACA